MIYNPVALSGYETRSDTEMQSRADAFRRAMQSRRTVRDFSPQPVPRKIIETCISVAASAPSGANLQPWHFAVIGSPELKSRIRREAEAEERSFYAGKAGEEWLGALKPLGTDPEKPFLEIAPWLICIFGSRRSLCADGIVRKNYYVPESVSIATGFLIAALHQAGLATLTHTPSPMGFLNDICGRPADEKPYILLVTGHPALDATVPEYASIKRPFSEIASFL
jgi:iodotyrosine deiodinase